MMTDLSPLYARLSEHRTLIAQRYQIDPSFREMCEDFCQVHGVLSTLHHSNTALDFNNVRAWEELLGEIEAEIVDALHTRTVQRSSRDDCVTRTTKGRTSSSSSWNGDVGPRAVVTRQPSTDSA